MKRYDKLVRDNIPDIIRNNHQTPIVRTLADEEYRHCLNQKLLEEVHEYLENNCIEELCDILEVVDAIRQSMRYADADVQTIRLAKAAKNGRFEKKLFLESVID